MGKWGSKEGSVAGWLRTCKRWSSPVYPTYGAFWGMGIGLGCGVGWGPGFGPEVVGYAGGGCGLGFSVGITLIGFGVGVPATGLTCLPYNFFLWTSNEACEKTASHVIPALILGAHQCWNAVGFQTIAIKSNLYKKTSAIKRDLRNFSETVFVPRRKNVCDNLHDDNSAVTRVVQRISVLKRFAAGKLAYRLQMKELRALHEFEKDADPQDELEIPERISLEYVVHPQESCGQIVRFSKTSKHFKKCAMREAGAYVRRPRDRNPYIPSFREV